MAEGSEWLADRGDGLPMDRSHLSRAWARDAERAGCRHIPFMKLRNSWRTFMQYEVGVSESLLEELMGHKPQGVSNRYYKKPTGRQIVQSAFRELAPLWKHLG